MEHDRVAIGVDGNAGDLAQPLGCVLCRPVRNWVQMGGLEILALANVCKEKNVNEWNFIGIKKKNSNKL